MKELREIQQEQAEWAEKNFGSQKAHEALLGVVEEVGELAHAQLKFEQGIRGFQDTKKFDETAKDAVGDIMVYLMNYCTINGWSMTKILNDVWEDVSKRDWVVDPQGG